jgi:hypothetical protein
VNVDAVPAEVRHQDRWVIWRREWDEAEQKHKKPPYQVRSPSRHASDKKPADWCSFAAAVAAAAAGDGDGVGYALQADDGLVFTDLDSVISGGRLHQTAAQIVRVLDGYTEVSQSGNGLHVLTAGALPAGCSHSKEKAPWGDRFEIYDNTRFMYMTGQVYENRAEIKPSPPEVLQAVLNMIWPPEASIEHAALRADKRANGAAAVSDQELLDKAFSAKNGQELRALYDGNTDLYGDDRSRADWNLLIRLAFWTGPDPGRLERLLLGSGLANHEKGAKWDRPTGRKYLGDTIGKVLGKCTEFYDWDTSPAGRRNEEDGDRAGSQQAPAAAGDNAEALDIVVVPLAEFVGVEEDGANPLLGEPDAILIPEDGDVMFYGDGGAGKTTLAIDLGFHLAAGGEWLGIRVPRPVKTLLIENEGPRPLLRKKLKRKLAAWNGGELGGRVDVFERPWREFTFASERWREKLALTVANRDIDVLIAGPLTSIGMDDAGTLQEVRAFMQLVADVRARSQRRLTVVLVHHENKGGKVSGAWEGSGDTLLHVQAAGNGHTIVHVQKARWDSTSHGTTLRLAWTAGEGFELEGDRDLLAEIDALLTDRGWRTVREIAAPGEKGGIGANYDAIKDLLDGHPDRFVSVTGEAAKALGRQPSAILWGCLSGSETPETPGVLQGDDGGGCLGVSPLRETPIPGTQHHPVVGVSQAPRDTQFTCCCADVDAEPAEDGRCSRCWGSLP